MIVQSGAVWAEAPTATVSHNRWAMNFMRLISSPSPSRCYRGIRPYRTRGPQATCRGAGPRRPRRFRLRRQDKCDAHGAILCGAVMMSIRIDCSFAGAWVCISTGHLTIAIAILLDDGAPVSLRTPGMGRPFSIWKFRSMRRRSSRGSDGAARHRSRRTSTIRQHSAWRHERRRVMSAHAGVDRSAGRRGG